MGRWDRPPEAFNTNTHHENRIRAPVRLIKARGRSSARRNSLSPRASTQPWTEHCPCQKGTVQKGNEKLRPICIQDP